MDLLIRTNLPKGEKVVAVNVDGKPIYDYSPNALERGDIVTKIDIGGITPTKGDHVLEILTESGTYLRFPFKL
jgi:hypothetical protein